jgi:peptide-methionine (R)-S-oxide reductase
MSHLSPEASRVLRQGGTERPFSSPLCAVFDAGTYRCVGCGAALFVSDTKFESGCGWPSFDAALSGSTTLHLDRTHGMVRTEVRCSGCGGHLGHVFPDGPTATGSRYCINGVCLNFEPDSDGQ